MSDYIRKDDVLALLEKYRIELPSTYSAGLTTAKNAVKGMSTEDDVVPRTEVAREIFEEIEINIFEIITPYKQALQCLPKGYIAELKQKYGVME